MTHEDGVGCSDGDGDSEGMGMEFYIILQKKTTVLRERGRGEN